MGTREKIIEEFRSRKGEMVLMMDRVYRFVGITEDEEDYYYALYDGTRIIQSSCVVRFAPLKGQLLEEDYKALVRIAKLNHRDQPGVYGGGKEGEETTEHLTHIKEVSGRKKFIEPPCWDIN